MTDYQFGGCLWLIVVTVIGYLLCSLFSWSFNYNDWNWFSKIILFIALFIESTVIDEIFRNRNQ